MLGTKPGTEDQALIKTGKSVWIAHSTGGILQQDFHLLGQPAVHRAREKAVLSFRLVEEYGKAHVPGLPGQGRVGYKGNISD